MKKLILISLILFFSCQKQYQCDIKKVTTVSGIVIDNSFTHLFCDKDLTNSECFNYEYNLNDTSIVVQTKCK